MSGSGPSQARTTLVTGGTLVTPDGLSRADLAMTDGTIAEVGPDLDRAGATVIDASNLLVLPGVIDAHVHLNDPGRADWEGWQTGTMALAAGGVTTAIDMPLNSVPAVTRAAAFDAKRAAAETAAVVDFALWGGLVPGGVAELEELHERGAIAFKAFMCESGIPEFRGVDDGVLFDGMSEAARLGSLVAVHAENQTITAGLAARARAAGLRSARDFLASRPIAAELEAITRAIAIAEVTSCSLHIVHVSCGRGVALVAEARRRGVDVSCETSPHYLVLSEADLERLGAVAKCAPPLRPAGEGSELWAKLADGTLPMVASDHSPAPAKMKEGEDFFAIWGGISGCQSMLEIVFGDGPRRGVSPQRLVHALAGFVARRFRLPGKGALVVGMDADLVLVDPDCERVLTAGELLYRHPHSPFVGRRLRCQVVRTILRGKTIYCDGEVVGEPHGRLLRPAPVPR